MFKCLRNLGFDLCLCSCRKLILISPPKATSALTEERKGLQQQLVLRISNRKQMRKLMSRDLLPLPNLGEDDAPNLNLRAM